MKINCTAEGFSSASRVNRIDKTGVIGLITAAVGLAITAASFIEYRYGTAWFVCDENCETQKTIWLDYKINEKHAEEYEKEHKKK